MGQWMGTPLKSLLKNVYFLHCGQVLLKSIDNLPDHKIALIEPLIKAVGAKVLNLSRYSPDFNPIELWWS
jgi:transposase